MKLFGRKPPPARLRSGGPGRVTANRDRLKGELAKLREEAGGSLIAAGQRVVDGQATLLRRLIQPWQIRSFGYYDLLGEIKYAAQFYSRSLSNLELYVAWRDDEGELVPVTKTKEEGPDGKMPGWNDADAAKALDALDRIKDPGGGGRSGLLAAFGRLMFLVGETYLFVSKNPDTGLEQWEMLSTDELRLNDGLYTRFKAPSLYAQQFRPVSDDEFVVVDDASAVAYRLWKRHPRFSDLADATMEGVLELCEELVLLTQAVRARARSRLAGSGILFLDQKITTTPLEPTDDSDPQEDPFIADLTEAMTAPIVDEGTASAVVPLVARVTVPEGMKLADLVYHLQIIDPTQIYPETGLRLECIRRIAIGLDMPAEILEGYTDANHWTGWLIDEQSWKAHLQPVAQQLVEDLTSAYFAPCLKQDDVVEWDRFMIAYDATAIINHPDRSKDAKDVHDRGELSGDALRTATGFDDDDAPSDEERNRWLGVKLRDSSVAVYGVPSLRSGSELEPDEGTLVGPDGTVTGEGESAASAEKAPPAKAEPTAAPETETVVGSALAAAMVEGAAQMALLRAREAAGARIRTAARRDTEAVALIDGVDARDVAPTLGASRVRALLGGAREAELVASARELVLDCLRMVGVTDATAAGAIADTIERHAARTLYERRPVLNGTFPEYVKGLLAATKGR